MLESAPTILAVSNLCYSYRPILSPALDDVSFAVGSGCFQALLGPNGAGKSTLLSLITGLRKLQHGSVAVAGADIEQQNLRALSKMGVVFQQPTLDLDLTVEQNLRYFAALNGLGTKQAKKRIAEELDRFGLKARRKERVRQLNGGHRRRVEIARALLHEPELLLFDEATVGLDVPTRQQIVDHVHQLCSEKEIAVLWATHLVDEVFDNDMVCLLDKGQIVGQGTCRNLLSEWSVPDLRQVFSQLVEREYLDTEVEL